MNGAHMDRIEEKLDRIDERLDSLDKNMAVNNTLLEYHIKRTDMLEEEVKPLKGHVLKAQGVLVFIGVLSTLVAVAVSVLNIIKIQ
jgi:hypothetical protein